MNVKEIIDGIRSNRITNPDYLAGKTIKEVRFNIYDAYLSILFEDDSFIYLAALCGHTESIELRLNATLSIFDMKYVDLISDETYTKHKEQKKEIEQKRTEAYEKEEYERLKIKFEGK